MIDFIKVKSFDLLLMTPLTGDAYANTLKRAIVNPLKISENMNHSSPITKTLHYLDQFEQ